MTDLILKKGIDLTPERIAEEIRKRYSGYKGSEPYTRVIVRKSKSKGEISIAVSEKGIVHETLDKSPLRIEEIDSMRFMDGVVNK